MIEKLIQNDLTLKRWRRFKKIRRAVISTWILVFLLFMSLTAEMWANSKPILLFYDGGMYVPVYSYHHPSKFGQEGQITNYRALDLEGKGWAIWPLIAWDPYESNKNVKNYPSPPTGLNAFGTDDRGRDVASRLIYGFRYSIAFAALVLFLTNLLGIALGALMGYAGGKTDLVGQRVVEIFESMPILLLLITLVSIFGASLSLLVIFTSIFGWMLISLYVRGEFLRLRRQDFVESARSLGVSKPRIIFKHILPNALGPVITFAPFTVASMISYLAILDYLGFGLPPPTPSWGELLQQAQRHFSIAWWLAVYPSAAIVLTLIVLNLIGEGVRDAFDPRK